MEQQHPELVLILAPYGRDAELLIQALARAGIRATATPTVEKLIESFHAGAACAVVADEAIKPSYIPLLAAALAQQPSWSDFPLLLLTGGGDVTEGTRIRLQELQPLGNLTLIERPLRTSTFVSAVQTALRARRRQYQIQHQMERQAALMASARENEEKLTFALEAARLGAWELRLPTLQLTASSQLKRNFGLHPEEPFPYSRWLSSVHPEDRARVRESVSLAFATRSAFETEYRILRPDGSTGWIFAAGRPVHEGEEGSGRVVGVTLDITDRRRGEEALRERESLLRALADSMPQLAWMANPDGYIFWYNRRWYEYTGTTMQQMEGWGWQGVQDPAILPEVLNRWRESIRTGEPFQMEFPIRSASGEYRWFLTQSRPVRGADGEVIRWFGTNTDIDDKRRAEKALRESEELARSVIEHSPDCVEVLDAEGHTVLVNAAVCRALGWTSGIEAEEGASWPDTWQGDDRRLAQHAVRTALQGEVFSFEASSRAESPGATRRWEVIVSPIVNSEGSVSRLLCISRDITARLQAEEEMRQTAKLESLGVMAGGIAHDFNNLLTGILGNASMLAESARDTDRGMAEDIVLAAERASDLTRQMLAYSGKGRFENRKIDLSSLVREMLRLVRPALDKNVDLDLASCRQPCLLDGDPGQIQQVIMNLMINAGEAMEGRPGKVTVSTGRIHLRAGMEAANVQQKQLPAGDYVYLEVNDNGKGMDEATRARIFDPFFTTKFTGRGLGLAAVSGIVRGHRGALQVTSEPGAGSTFRVLFPAAEAARQQPETSERVALRPGGGIVLLVDDEVIVQRTGAAALRKHGYIVHLAGNGKEAVELFRELHRTIDAVVLDMTMPVMNGEEAIEHMREIDADVPVIVCSGFNEVEVARRFQLRKVSSFLQKPYSAAMLVSKVQGVLGAAV